MYNTYFFAWISRVGDFHVLPDLVIIMTKDILTAVLVAVRTRTLGEIQHNFTLLFVTRITLTL